MEDREGAALTAHEMRSRPGTLQRRHAVRRLETTSESSWGSGCKRDWLVSAFDAPDLREARKHKAQSKQRSPPSRTQADMHDVENDNKPTQKNRDECKVKTERLTSRLPCKRPSDEIQTKETNQ